MKLLLDQGTPRSTAAMLREAGVDAVHTGETGLATAADSEVLRFARTEGRIVITLDADFHALLALSGAAAPSVVRIRIEGLKAEAITRLVLGVLQRWSEALERGAVVTVQSHRQRMRRLPLIR